jgi:lipoprotein-anchoring transpeptidase ErfK/SrfK
MLNLKLPDATKKAHRILRLSAFAVIAAVGASDAHSGERFRAPLFEMQPPTAEGMTTLYNDGQDEMRVGHEYPSSTREFMPDPTEESPGTITVDTQNRYLYLSLPNVQAVRYSIGVGREGFAWKGRVRIGRMAEWPDWTPPGAMLKRRPDLPRHLTGGQDNPLGARAMYLYSGKRDTMFRIHGSNEPWTIGEAVSSGCIRMLNEDVMDLFGRTKVGTVVVVL